MADLRDFRGKITPETGCVLDAISRVTGRDRSEVVREVLHRWALEEIEKQTVLAGLLDAEGLTAGPRGNLRDR